MESWELTEYERERMPQEVTINPDVSVSSRSFQRDIMCPVCLEILSQTRAAPDCLHRFCKKCIDKVVKKDCPVCHKKLPSQVKSFRKDPQFDQLILTLQSGIRDTPFEVTRNARPAECEVVLKEVNGPQIRYIKTPSHTTIAHLTKYLAIRPDCSKMPELETDEVYELYIQANRSKGRYEPLKGDVKLEEIKNSYKLDHDKPLELYFFQKEPSKR